MTKEEADEIIELIEKLKKDIRDFKAKNGWHYVSEEGLPEPNKEYWTAVHSGSGDFCRQNKLILSEARQISCIDPINDVVRSITIRSVLRWYDSDPNIMNWLNEYGRVYAWMPLPALPEVKE